MKIYSRARWGARTRVSPAAYDGTKSTMVVHHSAGFGLPVDTFSEQCAVMRQIERHHIDNNEWEDGGYNFVVFQPFGKLKRARVFELRGWARIPAAQGGNNTGTLAVCVVGNLQHEKAKTETLWRLVAIGRRARVRGITRLRGHRDYGGTVCPGANLYPKLDWIRKRTRLT